MRLHNLTNRPGTKHRVKRLGCGESSGHGKTSCRGGKGQSARSGGSRKIGFEGGQTRLIVRMPRRGFNNARHTIDYAIVKVEALNVFDDGATVTPKELEALSAGRGVGIKILGDGELKKKLNVSAQKFTASAKEKIEKAGGKCEVIALPLAPGARNPYGNKNAAKAAKAAPAAQEKPAS